MQSVLAKMAIQISANTAEMSKGLNQVRGQLSSFASNLQSIAGTLGLVFGVQQVASFTLEVSKLAGEFDAVKMAFDRLKDSQQLMEDLKKATNGTVSELDLMKRAVMASNFDISLKALPRLLEFATLRAQQTGQSVDYLVDSIVTGIGRKSKLILDNLGISAVQLNEALGGASTAASSIGEVADAVGRIAEQNLKNMAGFSDNAKSSMDKLSASWENLKVQIGQTFNANGGGALAKDAAGIMDVLSNKTLGWTQKVEILMTTWGNVGISEKLDEWAKKMDPVLDRQDRLNKFNAQRLINQYGGINQAITALGEEWREVFDIENKREILVILNQRLKESIDSVTRGLEKESEAATKSAKAYDEVFKSKAKLDFKKDIVPNVTNINQLTKPGKMPGKTDIPDELQSQVDGLRDVSTEIKDIQADLSGATADFVTDMAETIGASLAGHGNFGQGFLKAIANFGAMFGKQLIALGVSRLALNVAMSNPYAAIAAGAALVIASSAIAGSIGGFNAGAARGNFSGGGGVSQNSSTQSYEFRVRGSDLIAAMNSAQNDNRIRKGG